MAFPCWSGGDDNGLKYQQHHRNDQMELSEISEGFKLSSITIPRESPPNACSLAVAVLMQADPNYYENCKSKSH